MAKKIKVEIELELPDFWADDDVHPGNVTEAVHELLIKNGQMYRLLMDMRTLAQAPMTPTYQEALEANQEDVRKTYESAKLTSCTWEDDPDFNLLDEASNHDYKKRKQ